MRMGRTTKLIIVLFILVGGSSLVGCTPDIASLEAKGDYDRLIQLLENEDPQVVIAAAEALGRIGGHQSARELRGVVYDHADISVRKAAIQALGQFEAPIAVDNLKYVLLSDEPELRQTAIDTLSQMGTPAVQPLVDVLRESDPENVDLQELEGIVTALVLIGEEAIVPLLQSLREGPLYAREVLVIVLDALGWQPDADEDSAYYWIAKQAWEECAGIGASSLQPLMAIFVDYELGLKEMAAHAVGLVRDPLALAALIEIMNDSDRAVELRVAAITALAEIGGEDAVSALLSGLQYNEVQMRDAVLAGLRKNSEALISELAPSLTALAPLCQKEEISGIADLDATFPDLFYPLIVLDKEGHVNEWTSVFLQQEERTSPIGDLAVACVDRKYIYGETCFYLGAPKITRMKETMTFDLRDANTGARLEYEVFAGIPDRCPPIRSTSDPDRLNGTVSMDEIYAWLEENLPGY